MKYNDNNKFLQHSNLIAILLEYIFSQLSYDIQIFFYNLRSLRNFLNLPYNNIIVWLYVFIYQHVIHSITYTSGLQTFLPR